MHRVCFLVVALVILKPNRAEAHLVQTGFGGFYDGLVHLFVTPADLLVVLSLTLLAGAAGRATARSFLLVLPIAWLAGGILGPLWLAGQPPSYLAPVFFGLAGLLIALDRPPSRGALAVMAALGGVLFGWGNGLTLVPEGPANLPLVGVTTAIFVFSTLLAARVVSLRQDWSRIVIRVAGSWIAAIGLLMFGWLLR